MHILRITGAVFFTLLLLSCSKGGPLTPLESFNAIRTAVEHSDSNAVLKNLSSASVAKIDSLNGMIKQMRPDQIRALSGLYNCEPEKIGNMKRADYVSLYFFVKHGGTDLAVFREKVITMDIDGSIAVIRTQSGIELGFFREGPYWKLDISDL